MLCLLLAWEPRLSSGTNDAKLAHFFSHTNHAWLVDKQYSFLREKCTGQQVYFGDRPRNAHHWMVISDELFDYREEVRRRSDRTLRRAASRELCRRKGRGEQPNMTRDEVRDVCGRSKI